MILLYVKMLHLMLPHMMMIHMMMLQMMMLPVMTLLLKWLLAARCSNAFLLPSHLRTAFNALLLMTMMMPHMIMLHMLMLLADAQIPSYSHRIYALLSATALICIAFCILYILQWHLQHMCLCSL